MAGREINAGNTCWGSLIKNFTEQCNALSSSITDGLYVPKISKTLSVIKWTEYFSDFLNLRIRVQTITPSNVKIEKVTLPATSTPLSTNSPQYTENGSVEEELVPREYHAHPLYCDENSKVYY